MPFSRLSLRMVGRPALLETSVSPSNAWFFFSPPMRVFRFLIHQTIVAAVVGGEPVCSPDIRVIIFFK